MNILKYVLLAIVVVVLCFYVYTSIRSIVQTIKDKKKTKGGEK